jgi:hypothetical protein
MKILIIKKQKINKNLMSRMLSKPAMQEAEFLNKQVH